jgi:signal transduction histidine kinase/sugar lactone lactonase YvrE
LLLTAKGLALPASDLLVRSWSPGADVRQQSVRAMLQTRDGYLWVGTGKGLMRFDGVSFTTFTAENTAGIAGDDISFNTLWEDDAGVLWAGTYGRGIIRNDHGRFSTFLPDATILRIDGDQAGGVWIYTSQGVSQWQNDRLEPVHPEQDGVNAQPPIQHDDRRTGDFDRMGLWRRTPGALERFAYGAWRTFPTPPGEAKSFEDDVRSIYEDHLRRVWYSVASQPGRYFCAHDGVLTTYDGLPENAFVSYQDRAGYLWMNDHGAHPARWNQGKVYPLPELHTSFLLNVIERSDGVIWAGSFNTVLLQYRPRLISSIPTAGVPELGSVLFQQRSGAIWAGGSELLQLKAGAEAGKNGLARRPLFSDPDRWEIINALSEDAEGHLLIASRHHLGGVMLDRGTLRPYLSRGFDNSTIRAMLLASSGDQWIGTDTGLYRKQQRDGLERLWSGAVRCLAETSSHGIWAGTTEGPVQFEDGRQVPLAAKLAWSFGEVQGISVDRRGELWMATAQHGIVRLAQGGLRAFGTADGLPTDKIYSVNFGDDDDLWIRSDVGLMRIRRRSIEHRIADPTSKLQVTLFDQADGLPAADMEPPGNEGFLHLDGGIFWFATPGGIASLHPSDFAYQASSPHAILEEHVVDQSSRISGSRIVLAPGQRNLELHYTVLGSRRPEQVNFRYRMAGFDHGWIAAGTRRVAYYTQLPPGNYSFAVQAADGDDEVWEGTGAIADVRVLTPFYRTWWMKLLIGCVLIGGALFFLEARRRTEKERNRLRQAFTHRLITTQEGERKRIAHELHDSLGQHLVLIRTLALMPIAPANTARGDHLSKIADQAAVAIQEVESISYDLRPYQLDRLGLTRTILSLVEAFETGSSVRVTHSIESIDGFFPKDIEINVYRIVQEALGNILKHAEATEVSVSVARTGNVLRLIVADNGRGFLPSPSGPSHGGLGLVGIEERAEALGGHAVIESADRAGTKVIVTVTRMIGREEGKAL